MSDKLMRMATYIGGRWVQADSGKELSVYNPASGTEIGRVPNCGAAETEMAIAAASKAFPAWRALTARERGHKLSLLARLINDRVDGLAEILTLEQGKPLAQAKGELQYGAAYLQWFAEEARRVYGDVVASPIAGQRVVVLREPVGVVGCITPWNFPQAMLARKMGAALAAGCTMVAKPDERTPFSALALAGLADEAGIPVGVFNVVTGDPEPIAGALMASEAVRVVSFTGSTEVGKLLMRQAADTVKRVTLELGGNAPIIVFEDADVERAVKDSINAKFRNSGQTCICINRFLVHEKVVDKFTQLLSAEVAKLKVGDGMQAGVDIGPMISREGVDKVCRLVRDATAHGARISQGSVPDGESLMVPPIVLAGTTPQMQIFKEEIFGPVVAVYPFRDEAEAIALANSTEYGLAAYFHTRDLARAWRVAEQLQYGMIGINDSRISSPEMPFGGVKHSGFGREGGKYGMEEFTATKYMCLGL